MSRYDLKLSIPPTRLGVVEKVGCRLAPLPDAPDCIPQPAVRSDALHRWTQEGDPAYLMMTAGCIGRSPASAAQ